MMPRARLKRFGLAAGAIVGGLLALDLIAFVATLVFGAGMLSR
jgi:hypothetical protein